MSERPEGWNQCPHEVIRATCGGCNCDCASCVRITALYATPDPATPTRAETPADRQETSRE